MVRFNLFLPDDVHADLLRRSKETGVPAAEMIRRAIQERQMVLDYLTAEADACGPSDAAQIVKQALLIRRDRIERGKHVRLVTP